MKRSIIIAVIAVMMSGCASQETFETVSDGIEEVIAPAQQIHIELPDNASSPVMEHGTTGSLYICDDYWISVQTTSAGDLNQTFEDATGFIKDALTIMETSGNGFKRYDCVWACAGETGDQIGRLAILDDGNYHYILTAMGSSNEAEELYAAWKEVFDSFSLIDTD